MKRFFLSLSISLVALSASAFQRSSSTGVVQQSDGNPIQSYASYSDPAPSGPSGSVMSSLANSASVGIGKSNEGPYCYRSVKKIIAHALGKNHGCVRGILSGGSAVNAMQDLPKAGFQNDMSSCNTQGVIRVYRGYRGAGRTLAGDIHGHVEILGTDNNFHSFYSSPEPIDKTMGSSRRRLVGCFVATDSSIANSRLGQCNAGSADQPQKKRRSGRSQRNRR